MTVNISFKWLAIVVTLLCLYILTGNNSYFAGALVSIGLMTERR